MLVPEASELPFLAILDRSRRTAASGWTDRPTPQKLQLDRREGVVHVGPAVGHTASMLKPVVPKLARLKSAVLELTMLRPALLKLTTL